MICGPAWYCPQPDVHICASGPVWSATTIPSDEYVGLASPAEGVWVATGRGQAGTAPTKTAVSGDNGTTWAAGGTIPNNGNITPSLLTFGNGRLLCYAGGDKAGYSDTRGTSWALGTAIGGSTCVDLKFGGGEFVFVSSAAALVYKTTTGLGGVAFTTPAVLSCVFWDASRARWLCFESAGTRVWGTNDFVTFTLLGNLGSDGVDVGAYDVAQSDTGTILVVHFGSAIAGERSVDGGTTWAVTGDVNNGSSQSNSPLWGNGGFIVHNALGSNHHRSNDDGQTFVSSNAHTMTKTWFVKWDGLNTYVAVGSSGGNDAIANIGIC